MMSLNCDSYKSVKLHIPKTDLLKFVEKPKALVEKKIEEQKETLIKKEEEVKSKIEEKPKPKEIVKNGMRTVGGENTKTDFEKKPGLIFPVNIQEPIIPKVDSSIGSKKDIFSGTNKLKDSIMEIKTATNSNLFSNPISTNGLFSKPEVKKVEPGVKPTPVETKQIQPQITQPKQEVIKQSAQVTSPVQPKQEIKTKTFKDSLLEAANIYYEKRNLRIQISNSPGNKRMRDKIMIEIINPTLDQLVGEEVLNEKVRAIQNLLKELYEERLFEMYDFTLNYLCQKILNKSENYLKDRKLLLVLSKFVYMIKLKHKILEDFFIMILAYKCPYIIPKVFTKKDFPDKEIYMKRLGYSDPEEPISTWINNMECYCYLFFGFLSLDDKYSGIVKNYMTSMESITVDYPISTAFKVFLNTLGAKVKAKFPEGITTLKKTVKRYIDELESLKSKTKSSELKSITSDNIHFIKKYFQNINTGVATDYYSNQ
jgi:hypothetical protein